MDQHVSVTSEVGTLKRLLVHSPDSGLGKWYHQKHRTGYLKTLFT